MRIEKVCLENVKSYGDGLTEISLGGGVNAVLGENGAGKSTVLEAVGYALFDYLSPYTQEDFLRDGADEGRIRVKGRANDRVFIVERYVGRSTYRVLQDGEEVMAQKQDVVPWLRDKLGIPETLDLSTLWNACIGVPQGKLTMDFTKPPRERRRSFDPVLQTAAYTDAWEGMRDVEREIEDEISESEREIEGLKVKAGGFEEKVQEKEGIEGNLRDLKDSKAEAEKKLSELQEEKNRLEKIKESVETLRAKLEKRRSKIKSAKESLQDAKNLRDEAEEAKKALESSEDQHQKYKKKEGEKEILKEKLEGKEDVESSLSNLAKKLAQLRARKKTLEESAATARKAEKRMEKLEKKVSKQESTEEKISESKAEIKRLEESISLLRNAEKAECPTCDQLLPKDQKEKVLNSHREVKSEIEGRVSDLEDGLETLGSPKNKMEEAKTRYRDNKQAEKKLSEVKGEVGNLEERKQNLKSSLEEYEGLEEKIDALDEKLGELEGAHERYMKNENLASKLQEREGKVKKLREKLKRIREEKKEFESELDKEEGRFDEGRYRKVSSKVESFASKASELRARIEERENNLKKLKREIERKKEAKEKLERKEKDRKNLKKDLEFAGFIRKGIRDAQPLVTEVLVQKVSETASGIFRQLRGETQSLTWTRDYQIVVRDGEEEKAFHKLSGGEQVCAALAVRLAILQRLAPVSFAFLDEPTENLDDARRRNLASRLKSFEALDQLCVVSHDRIFENMAERVVSLEKRGRKTTTARFSRK